MNFYNNRMIRLLQMKATVAINSETNPATCGDKKRNSVNKDRPHVALLVETSLASGRDILRGISRYLHEHIRWGIFHSPRSLEDKFPAWLENWKGDGIIARIQNPEMVRAIKKTGIPVVDVLGIMENTGIPLVHVDDREIAHMGAKHLLERGFRHFAYVGIKEENWSNLRRDYFQAYLSQYGHKCHLHELKRHTEAWEKQEDQLAKWIKALPKPLGIMVCSDQRGLDIIEAARRANVAIPDEVAIIGVDNDDPLCEVSSPPLSSIKAGHSRVGYEAAALLDRLMLGAAPPSGPIFVPPVSVVARQSTDVLAIEDENISTALKMIRDTGCDELSVDDVARCCGLSRSVLQRRFRKMLDHTVHQEIINVRLKRSCELLAETDLTLIDIAEKAGFKHQEYMGVVFRKHLGMTPAQYRKNAG
ncbi:DNA-binding transcriptional regulator [Verrucomicrobia bacterium]|nr:DNA-binding transcriptional regulator [Verrucomicrobiota bacterium]